MDAQNYNEHTHDPERMGQFNFDHIIDGIYIGNNMCCNMGLSQKLKAEGISVDISVDDEKIDQPFGVDAFLWIPAEDGLTPSNDIMKLAVSSLDQFVQNDRKVYVHCQKGHGRSASIVMAYLLHKRYSFDEAFTIVKTARDDIHLNSTQVEILKNLYKST